MQSVLHIHVLIPGLEPGIYLDKQSYKQVGTYYTDRRKNNPFLPLSFLLLLAQITLIFYR